MYLLGIIYKWCPNFLRYFEFYIKILYQRLIQNLTIWGLNMYPFRRRGFARWIITRHKVNLHNASIFYHAKYFLSTSNGSIMALQATFDNWHTMEFMVHKSLFRIDSLLTNSKYGVFRNSILLVTIFQWVVKGKDTKKWTLVFKI